MELNYQVLENEIIELLSKKKTMVFATSDGNHVTARSMSVITDGLNVYFQTSRDFQKCSQIAGNPSAALCSDNIAYEGKAFITGGPYEIHNTFFRENFPKAHAASFESYSRLPDQTVIMVKPSLITLWKYGEPNPFRDFLDVENRKAWRIIQPVFRDGVFYDA